MTIENQATVMALKDRVAELEVLLERNRQAHNQTYDDLRAELKIARERYVRQGTRADELEQTCHEQGELIGSLNSRIHHLKDYLAAAFGALQLFAPTEEALKVLAAHCEGDERVIVGWPVRLTSGDFRTAADVVKHLIERRISAA